MILLIFAYFFLSSQILQKFSDKLRSEDAVVAVLSAGLLNDGLRKGKAYFKTCNIAQTKVIGLLQKLLGEVLWAKSKWRSK